MSQTTTPSAVLDTYRALHPKSEPSTRARAA